MPYSYYYSIQLIEYGRIQNPNRWVIAYQWCVSNFIKKEWRYQGNGVYEFDNKIDYLTFIMKFI
jgi:hypothetical protein